MKISFISTVFNESKTIEDFLISLSKQTKKPDEIIITDALSTDDTVEYITKYFKEFKKQGIICKLISKRGNRAAGRNEAIRQSSGDIIVASDAGCSLDKDWIKHITDPFQNKKITVVSGYYYPITHSFFEKCLAPYTSVMEDKIDPDNFLPSSRSIALRKSAFEKVHGYPEYVDTCEDLLFAKNLKEAGCVFMFKKDAFVFWPQRKNIWQAAKQFFSYAKGDGQAGYIREQTPFLFARYFLAVFVIAYVGITRSLPLIALFTAGVVAYFAWAIKKNYHYIHNIRALYYLPLLQITSDFSVLSGMLYGLLTRVKYFSFKKHVFLICILLFYSAVTLATINWGIPNTAHPFTYHMDEWHFSQGVRYMFKLGTPNVPGAANGMIFYFFQAGIFLIPFTLLSFIHPFAIKSSVEQLLLQHNLFIVLRLNTLGWGLVAITTCYTLLKKFTTSTRIITLLLLITSPIFLTLSNYFKYDIALFACILISIMTLFVYIRIPTKLNFILLTVIFALTETIKISAIPLLPLLYVSYMLVSKKKKLSEIILSILVYLGIIAFLGFPDALIGKAWYGNYFDSNLVSTPNGSSNYILGMHYYLFLFLKEFPAMFGQFFLLMFLLLLPYLFYLGIKKRTSFDGKENILLILGFLLFFLSICGLKLGGGSNRSLVLLPWMLLIVAKAIESLRKDKYRAYVALVVSVCVIVFQVLLSFSWLSTKWSTDPRVSSSTWITHHIPQNSVIGIENIPIYQMLPDFLLQDFYNGIYKVEGATHYQYVVLNGKEAVLPSYVVLTNDDMVGHLLVSPKKDLVRTLLYKKYHLVKVFAPQFSLLSYFVDRPTFWLCDLIPMPTRISIYQKTK